VKRRMVGGGGVGAGGRLRNRQEVEAELGNLVCCIHAVAGDADVMGRSGRETTWFSVHKPVRHHDIRLVGVVRHLPRGENQWQGMAELD